jgi:hypothetical protein
MAEQSNVGVDEAPANLLGSREREELLEYHPIKEREYILPTPMMERAYGAIRERVWARRTGAVFYAYPRMGKTRCAFAVKSLLEEEFPKCYVTLMSALSTTRPSDSRMFSLLLSAEKHPLAVRKNALSLLESAVADIEVKTKSRGGNQYILIIDEMQCLDEVDLQQLVAFHNALEIQKIRMTTISFAQPQISHRRTALLATDDRQIIARFLSELMVYDGCADADELKQILRAFDENSEFPEGSGWTYTRFFVPLAFANGFRLATYSSRLWRELSKAVEPSGGSAIPMEHTCIAIENLLLSLRLQDCAALVIGDSDIYDAVESSNLKSFSSSMG